MSVPVPAGHIEEVFWRACDALRRRRATESSFLLSLRLFLVKFLSDLARDKREFSAKAWRGQALWGSLDIPASCDWVNIESHYGGDLIGILRSMLGETGMRSREGLGGIFNSLFVEHEDEIDRRPLYDAVMLFSHLDLRPSRLSGVDLGEVYERIIERFSESLGSLGDFYVPEQVSELVARLARPLPGESIYDPYCRSGQLLTRLAKHSKNPSLLVGQVSRPRDASLAKINMLLHGWSACSRVEVSDPIASPLVARDGALSTFDVVVSNPPFGIGDWAHEVARVDPHGRFRRGVPPTKMADYAFISHIVESMRRGTGRSVVVVSHGTLFRGGNEASIRKALIEENLVHGVVALPSGLFSATRIPIALVVLKSEREDRRVLFVDASHSFVALAGRNYLRDQDVDRIAGIFDEFEVEEEFSNLASHGEIRKNDFNLNVSRYVHHKNEASRSVDEIWSEAQPIQEELEEVKGELDTLLRGFGFIPD